MTIPTSAVIDNSPLQADIQQMRHAGAWPERLLLLAAAAIVLVSAPRWWVFTIDDTFISLRYAHHLAIGQGLVFNPGERVEGFSCPGWVLGLALVERLGGSPLAAAKGIGLACALALVLLLHAALRRSGVSRILAGLAAIWLAVQPGLHFHACSGMETLPFALAVALAITIPWLVPSPVARGILLPLILLAVATLRPEGLLVLAILVPLTLIQEESRAVRVSVLVLVPIVAALLLARHSYYGEWLPNTFLAKPSPLLHYLRQRSVPKVIEILSASIRPGAPLHAAIQNLGGPVLLFGIAIAALRGRTARPFASASAAALVGVAFLLYAPEDWMPGDRFALPFAFPLILLGAIGANALLLAATTPVRRTLAVALPVLVLTESALRLLETNELFAAMRRGALNSALDARKYEEIGRWLAASALPTDRVLAYEVGAVGYFSGLRIVDHEGLVDREVARIIDRAGGYFGVRTNLAPTALKAVVERCTRPVPEWYLLRIKSRTPPLEGTSVLAGIAREPIQNALLSRLRATMVVAKVFSMRETPDGLTEWYILLGQAPVSEAR